MDISAIPRMHSTILFGLDLSMKPELARFESIKGCRRTAVNHPVTDESLIRLTISTVTKAYPELKVMHIIKSVSIMVYTQEKMTPYYHKNVCDGRNTLAYFICAVHRQSAPQPVTVTHDHPSSTATASSKASKSSCRLPTPGKNCDLPKLSTSSMLPLGYWDSLYYAVLAEIRMLHADLSQRFGYACTDGDAVMHRHGTDGHTDEVVTATDLLSILEAAWYALIDHRVVIALDDAVRMKNLRESAAQEEVDRSVQQFLQAIKKGGDANGLITPADDAPDWPPPIVPGLVDVCGMTPETIIEMLWEKHAPAINRACLENFEDESMLTAYRAELHAKEVEAAVAAGTPLPSASFCTCRRACVCKLKCDESTELCTCLNGRAQIHRMVREQEAKKQEIHTTSMNDYHRSLPSHFLGAATDTLAQMQIAALATPTTTLVQACHDIHAANNTQELHVAKRMRERGNTNDSQLVYVPESRPLKREPKDAYPLNFYRDFSPQRYPKMQRVDSKMQALPPLHIPARKPVPAPIFTNPDPYGLAPSAMQLPTPPSSNPYSAHSFMGASQVIYPPIPASQSQGIFTQSFPPSHAGNARAGGSGLSAGYAMVSSTHTNTAYDYASLLPRHPSTLDEAEQAAALFVSAYAQPESTQREQPPSPKRAPTPPQNPKPTDAARISNTFKTLPEKAQPPLPLPDFIAPRPAYMQRYVSAGGTAKFADRPEVAGPPLAHGFAAGGIRMSKEELEAKVSDPEFVRRFFGQAAVGLVRTLSPPQRRSVESNKGSGRGSGSDGRLSDETDRGAGGTKRDRTSSSASRGVAKLKRVFSSRVSRKSSGSDGS